MTRAPVFAGVTDGVGTTTLAVALHAVDGGRHDGRPVDVLVCRADGESLARAAAATGASVLAVVESGPVPGVQSPHGGLPDAARAWIDRLRPGFGAVVVLPHVERWRGLEQPAPEVAALLAGPAGRRSAFAVALMEIIEALLRSGTLARPGLPVGRPPRVPAGRAPDFPRVISRASVPTVVRLEPSGRPPAPSPWRGSNPAPGPDDDALEAGLLSHRRTGTG